MSIPARAKRQVASLVLGCTSLTMLSLVSLSSHAEAIASNVNISGSLAVSNETDKPLIFEACTAWSAKSNSCIAKKPATIMPNQTRNIASMSSKMGPAKGLLVFKGPKGNFSLNYKFTSQYENSSLILMGIGYRLDLSHCDTSASHGINGLKCCTYVGKGTSASYDCWLSIEAATNS